MNTPTVYMLSVGINTYASGIKDLTGCEKDVTEFRNAVIDLGFVKQAHSVTLLNEQATRQEIINTFRDHFRKMNDGDIAVFHFSGHGSQENTPDEFANAGLEVPAGRIESIVPHDRSNTVYTIADKELRWLIHEIQKHKPNAQFISILDCCHSGSTMRDNDCTNVRKTSYGNATRPLDSFLEGQFQKMQDYTGTIHLPDINYILLAACAPDQSALELNDGSGGYFTNELINILIAEKGRLTYSHIYSILQNRVIQCSNGDQTPQLEYAGNGNPHTYFLTDKRTVHNMPVLIKKGDYWQTNVGQFNGVSRRTHKTDKLPIYSQKDDTNLIGTAQIIEIKKETTVVAPEWIDSLHPPQESELLFIGLSYAQIPIAIQSDKNDFNIDTLQGHFLRSDHAGYKVDIQHDSIKIHKTKHHDEYLIIGIDENSDKALKWLRHQLAIIGKWETIKNICTPRHSIIRQESVQIHFSFSRNYNTNIQSNHTPSLTHSSAIVHVQISNVSQNEDIPYQITIQNEYSKKLFFVLLHLDKTYQICNKYEDPGKSIPRNGTMILYNSINDNSGFGISDSSSNYSNDHFILFASETPFSNAYQFEQEGFKDAYEKIVTCSAPQLIRNDDTSGMPSDWIVKKLVVQLKRE